MTNPVSSTDRVFLRHFSMVIGFLILVMIGLIALAMHIYGNHPAPPRPEAQQEIAARIAPAGAVYAGDTGRAALLAAQDAAKKAAESQVAYGGTLDGKTIFDNLCTTCHTNSATGAPNIQRWKSFQALRMPLKPPRSRKDTTSAILTWPSVIAVLERTCFAA